MRKIIISLAAAASALALAAPAAAQWAQPQQRYGQQGYAQDRAEVRALQNKVERVRDMIQRFDRSNRLNNREARRLDAHAVQLRQRVHHAAQRGLHFREKQELEMRVQSLREAVRYAARENRRWGWNGQDGRNAYGNSYGYYGERLRDDERNGDDRRDRRDRG